MKQEGSYKSFQDFQYNKNNKKTAVTSRENELHLHKIHRHVQCKQKNLQGGHEHTQFLLL